MPDNPQLPILPKEDGATPFIPKDWCLENRGHGDVSPFLLAPDPDQPRRYMDPEELRELSDSIREMGVVEPIVVTPLLKTPWVTVSDKYQDAFFVIVSGHRRWQAALDTDKSTVPVRVRIYGNAEKHEADMILLNGPRANLTHIEEAYEVVRLLRQEGVTLERVARIKGKSVGWVQGRIALTKLDPDIQKLLNPRLKAHRRLQTQVGTILGELAAPSEEVLSKLLFWAQDTTTEPSKLSADGRRFCFQRLLLAEILNRRMSVVKAKDFIYESVAKTSPSSGLGSRSNRDKPNKRRLIVLRLLDGIRKSSVFGWSDEALKEVFKTASLSQLVEFANEAKVRVIDLEALAKTLTAIRDEKQQSMQEQSIQSGAPAPAVTKPSQKARPKSSVPVKDEAPSRAPRPTPAVSRITPSLVSRRRTPLSSTNSNSVSFPMERIEFWDYGPPGRLHFGVVRTPFHFTELWKQKRFGWQTRGEPKPTHFPNLAEIQAIMGR